MAESKKEFKERISKMKLKKLKKKAKDRNIDTSKCKTKKDYISALLDDMEDEGDIISEANEEEVEIMTEEERAKLDDTLKSAINEEIEFREVEQTFSQIEVMYRTGDFKETLNRIEDVINSGEETLEKFQKLGLSLAILSSQKLIDSLKEVEMDTEDAEEMLLQAKKHFVDERYSDATKEVWNIKDITQELHQKHREKLTELIRACEADIEKAKTIGAGIGAAEHVLNEARISLENDFLISCTVALRKAQGLVEMGGKDRKTVILETITFVEKMIEEASGIGADVKAPFEHLEKAKELFDKGEYTICMQTTVKAEQATTEAIQTQVEKAKELQKSLEDRYMMVSTSVPYQQQKTEYGKEVKDTEPAETSGEKHPCQNCGKSLDYIKEYKRWYCYQCNKYA